MAFDNITAHEEKPIRRVTPHRPCHPPRTDTNKTPRPVATKVVRRYPSNQKLRRQAAAWAAKQNPSTELEKAVLIDEYIESVQAQHNVAELRATMVRNAEHRAAAVRAANEAYKRHVPVFPTTSDVSVCCVARGCGGAFRAAAPCAPVPRAAAPCAHVLHGAYAAHKHEIEMNETYERRVIERKEADERHAAERKEADERRAAATPKTIATAKDRAQTILDSLCNRTTRGRITRGKNMSEMHKKLHQEAFVPHLLGLPPTRVGRPVPSPADDKYASHGPQHVHNTNAVKQHYKSKDSEQVLRNPRLSD